ncbi:MAG: hypothetical protein LBB23_01280 [Rickettsiales bacterium]|nr:hypothetical protein [Rickettsiales bacterium]
MAKKLLEVSTHTPSSFFHHYSPFYPRRCDTPKCFLRYYPLTRDYDHYPACFAGTPSPAKGNIERAGMTRRKR